MPYLLPKYLPERLVKQLLSTPYRADVRDLLILRLLACLGLRASEVCDLTRRAFNFDEETLTVRGKGKKDRVIPLLHLETVKLAEAYVKDMPPDQNVFQISRQAVASLVDRYAKRAGIDQHVHPHMLRHSFAVYSLKSGVDIRSLSKALGHKNLTTTAIYLDIVAEDVKTAYRNHPLPY